MDPMATIHVHVALHETAEFGDFVKGGKQSSLRLLILAWSSSSITYKTYRSIRSNILSDQLPFIE